MRTLVKNGTVVTAVDQCRADVLVDGEVVAAIGRDLPIPADRVIDATGKYVLPGGVDVHTHLDLPMPTMSTADDFESGTIAAAHGGTTTIIDFAIQYKGQSLHAALENWFKKADGKAATDYGFHMILTDLSPQFLAEMRQVIRDGVTSFKLFMAFPGVFMLDDASIYKGLAETRDNGGFICMHAENGGVIDTMIQSAVARGAKAPKYHALTRPTSTEAEATARAIALAAMAEAPIYFVHLSCAEALTAVSEARQAGLPVFAETCPHYLLLSVDQYDSPEFEGAKYVCAPPLRDSANHAPLWRGLARDDLQIISTDHCPFCFKEQKVVGREDFSKIPYGVPGIEDRLTLVYSAGVKEGRISLNRFVDLVATAPAKMFGLFPRKGTIAVGSDADLVVFDPEAERVISAETHHMKVDYNLYEGRKVKGAANVVMQRGRVLVENGKFLGRAGEGSFLRRQPFNRLWP